MISQPLVAHTAKGRALFWNALPFYEFYSITEQLHPSVHEAASVVWINRKCSASAARPREVSLVDVYKRQTLPVDGIIVVASPQELVSMIVGKAVKMAQMMNIPILGVVENMSYVECPDCGKQIKVFGESHVDEVAAKYNIPVLAKCPIDPKLAECADQGLIEVYGGQYLNAAADAVQALLK